ncbi:MAG TPA: 5'/3'-nucleotidase SurE, partial [Vicinamibacterales bacterium]|nr:5'/3'-nucleotidase SurE [Vicinamibacterales bacterium]
DAHVLLMFLQGRGRVFAPDPPMRILVCNDDGIYSPGIAALAEVASAFGTVRIVAPHVEQSGMGHAISAGRPLSFKSTRAVGPEAYRVNGTPADSVALGAFKWGSVDLVLSGCNLGFNLGNSTWHSGTLAAAKQAALLGLRGIAVSAPAGMEDFTALKPWMHRVLDTLVPATELNLVNVNLPSEPRGLIWTRVSVRQYDGVIVPTTDPMGRELYWFSVTPLEAAEEGTDRWAVEQNWISMTPLCLDVTDHRLLEQCRMQRPLDEELAAKVSPPRSSPEDERKVHEEEAPTAAPTATRVA